MLLDTTNTLLPPLLFIIGLTAGTVDAIAGGGGLISLPALLAVGMPPHIALGTNKLQSTIGTAIATFTYYRQNLISLKIVWRGLIFGFLGAALGAWASQMVSDDILRKVIPILIFFVLLYTIFSPKLGFRDEAPKMKELWFYGIFGFVLGFYDGFLGPGVGSLWIFSLVIFLGYNLVKAAAYTKVFNLKSNIVATVCFMLGSNLDYKIALCMAAGQIIGGKLGAHLAITKGARLIRPMFILIVSATVCMLIYEGFSDS